MCIEHISLKVPLIGATVFFVTQQYMGGNYLGGKYQQTVSFLVVFLVTWSEPKNNTVEKYTRQNNAKALLYCNVAR